MGRLRYLSLAALLHFPLSIGPASAASLKGVIGEAKKEGALELHAASSPGPAGAPALGAAFNKKHGLNIKVNDHPSGNMTRDVAKIGGLASSVPPE